MVHKIKVLCLVLIVSMGVLGGCTPEVTVPTDDQTTTTPPTQPEEEEKPSGQKKDELTIAMQDPITLHPIYNMDKSVQQNLHLIFDTLVNIEEDGNITPNIAESWEYNEVDYTLKLKIRQDIVWHDGQKLKADDVVFSIKTIQEAAESPYKQSIRNIAHVQQVDDYNLTIHYRQPFSGVYQTLFFPVIPQHIYDVEREVALEQKPIGSGPYQYVENANNNKLVTFVANPTYFAGEPNIQTIQVMTTPDEESMLYAFEQNLIDVIYTDVMDWGKYAKDKSAKIHEMNTQYYEFMGLNFNYGLFENEKVREALAYGLDREKLLDIYYLGHGTISDTPISPYSYLYHDSIEVRSYHKEKAKLILAEEGYVIDPETKIFMKNGNPLSFSLLVNSENTQRVRIAEGIKEMYESIGVVVEIESVSSDIYLQKLYDKEFEAFLGGWKLSYVPDLSFAFHSSQIIGGDNFVSYADPKMDELLQQAFVSSPNQIVESYEKLQEYIIAQNPYISLYFRNAALITKKQIQGNIDPDPLNIYANIEEWKID